MAGARVWFLAVVALFGTASILTGCQSTPPTPPTPPTPSVVDLEGLWIVTPSLGTTYGAGGTTTLEFGPEPTGVATFLSRSDENGITSCERHVYSAMSADVVMLDGAFFVADVVNADRIVLSTESVQLALDRVTGAPPVAACDEVDVVAVATFDVGTHPFSSLDAVGTSLVFNTGDADESIVVYETATGTLGTPRAYTGVATNPGTHRFVVGARTVDLLYGHCGCGSSRTLDRFDLSANASLASIHVPDDLGVDIGIRYGYFDDAIVIGGGRYDAPGVNELLTLDADTLALLARRQFLAGTIVEDVTLRDGSLLALTGARIVVVGADGRAQRTIEVGGLAGALPTGLASVGDTVYLLARTADLEAMLVEVPIP